MTTPLIILAILILPAAAGWLWQWRSGRDGVFAASGAIALGLAFLFFATGHFVLTDAMVDMLPPFLPLRREAVLATGVLEIALGLALFLPRLRGLAGRICILVLIVFFGANIYAALNHTGTGGHVWGPIYLVIRAPLQLLLIGWAWWFTQRIPASPGMVTAKS